MPTYTALTTVRGKEPAENLGMILEDLEPSPMGVGVFEIEDGSGLFEVGGYFTTPPDEVALSLIAVSQDAKPFVVSKVPDKDWVAEVRRELAPVHAGRFFLYGSHDAHKVPRDCVPLRIEAAMAFGTGHHGTTQGCLMALDQIAAAGFKPQNVADVGCGTAVLAMAAAKLWDVPVLASDIDKVATETAQANLNINQMRERIDILTCAGFDHPRLQSEAPFDLIFANILKGPLISLAPDVAKYGKTGGYVILSGILNGQAEEVIEIYYSQGFTEKNRLIIGEWSTLILQRSDVK